jgi:uncharacterized damage-inducible protein DinB
MNANGLEGQKALLLGLLRSSYDEFAWHGPNLMQALAGVGLRQIVWRADAPVWNIHEVTLHVADVMQKCSAELFGARVFRAVDQDSFPLADVTGEAEWIETLGFLQQAYAALESGLRTMPASALTRTSPSNAYNRTWSVSDHIKGVALHNTYHAAQIVFLRKRQGAWTELA